MILRKYMAMLGVGSAQIDLILEKDTYRPGEQVKGHFVVKGGLIEQQLKRIECDLILTKKESRQENASVVDSLTIFTTKTIESDTYNHIPFSFRLPDFMDVNCNMSYRFKSRLSFHQGVESLDHDEIRILEA